MLVHLVDTNANRIITDDDLGLWLLSYLETHGAIVTLDSDDDVHVRLDGLSIDGATARRWAPIAVALLPRFRELLLARRAVH